MKYSPEQLKKLHEAEIEIFSEISRICENNNIQYFGFYGTALGAVRHKGFIPWDDDMDIAMFREDYERFLAIAPSQLKPGYSLQHFSTEHDTPTYFAKVRKDGTKFIESYLKHLNIHHGIYVDIFPLDKVPIDEKQRKRHFVHRQFWLQLFIAKTLRTTAEHVACKPHVRFLANTFRTFLHILLKPVKKSFVFDHLDMCVKKYSDSDSSYVAYCDALWTWNSDDFFPLEKIQFENCLIPIPRNYDEVLKIRYGDYMTIPPEDKQISHLPYELSC